ncbi:MAG: RICIN domain-containing protein [Eubacterium sp.]|nr:RICIN domain-containing protein [Eubacterium sp.]
MMKRRKSGRLVPAMLAFSMILQPLLSITTYAEETVRAESDFSSRRLLVGTSVQNVIRKQDTILSSYEGSYLLQFASAAEAESACHYYTQHADFAEPDGALIQAASEENETQDTRSTPDITSDSNFSDSPSAEKDVKKNITDVKDYHAFTEETNPLSELSEASADDFSGDFSERTWGNGVIALIDTGVGADEHIIESVSMLGDDASDDNGHGTRMVQYITAEDPDARILSIKALDAGGKGTPSSVYAAIRYAMERKVSIINLSLSGLKTSDSSAIAEIIKGAVKAGITVIGAAGNDGRNAKYSIPGGIEEAVIAGAVNGDNQRTGQTNYGSTVDYYVVSDSSSEAAARLSGIYSRTGSFLKQGTVFSSVLDESRGIEEKQSGEEQEQRQDASAPIQVKVISKTENGKIIDVNGIWFLASRDFDTSVPWKMIGTDTSSAELSAASVDLSPVACQSVNHSYGYGNTEKEVAFVNGVGGLGLFDFGGIQSGMLNVSTAYSLMTNTGTEFYGKPHDDAFCIEEGQIFHTNWQKTTDLVGAWVMAAGTNRHQITADEVKRMALARDYAYAHNSNHTDRYRDAQACVYSILGALAYSKLSEAQKNAIAYADRYKDNATIVYARRMSGGNNQDVAIFEVKLNPVYARIHKLGSYNGGSVAGAQYEIYYDGKGFANGGKGTGQTFTIGSDGYSNVVTLEPSHTYWYHEMTPPSNGHYAKDDNWYQFTASDVAGHTNRDNPLWLDIAEPDNPGYLYLTKTSANPDATRNNRCYSLEGAEFTLENTTPTCQIINKKSGKAVELQYTATNNNTNVLQWPAYDGINQKFILISASTLKPISVSEGLNNIFYIISAKKMSMALDAAGNGTANNTNIQLYSWLQSSGQKFRLESVGDGYYKIVNVNSGKVLDVAHGSVANDANIQLYEWNGTDAQKWKFESKPIKYTLTTDASGNTPKIEAVVGTYHVTETKAPKGYKAKTNIPDVTVDYTNTSSNPAHIQVQDTPGLDPVPILLQKRDAETGKDVRRV